MDTTYELVAGSLPPGLSLTAGGHLGGTPSADGRWVFTVRASNVFGSEADASFAIRIYETPDTSIDMAPGDPSSSSSASFAYSAASGKATFECELDGGGFAACGASGKTYTGLSDGSHTFTVRATDPAGNTDPTPASHTWGVDTEEPGVIIDSGPSGTVGSRDASFAFHSEDVGATFRCSFDGEAYAACTSPATASGLTDGLHTFRVKARDAAGNRGDEVLRIWMIDGAPAIDALVKGDADASFLGDGVRNPDGTGQTKLLKVLRGKLAVFQIQVGNDSLAPDTPVLAGGGGLPGFKVTYWDGATEVTADVTGAGLSLGSLDPGESKTITMKVKTTKKASGARMWLVTATSGNDAGHSDAVGAKVKVKAG